MKLLIVQLSDIHFKKTDNSLLEKTDSFVNAIRNYCKNADEVIVLMSGDVAFSGQKEEYSIAFSFFSQIREKIEKYISAQLRFVFIPGNHDCDLSNESKARSSLISLVQQSGETAVDDSVVSICTEVQKNYKSFVNEFMGNKLFPFKVKHADGLLKVIEFKFGKYVVVFNCYNSAFMSQRREQPGKMFFPISLYADEVFVEQATLNVGVLHHPPHWLSPNNRREFVKHLDDFTNFYFTGHEHVSTVSAKDDLEGNVTYWIEGGVLQDSDDPGNSGFNMLFYNLEKQQFCHKKYKWNRGIYESASGGGLEWKSYVRASPKIKNQFSVNDNFDSFLNDTGANYSHPYKREIVLGDIYVYPRLRQINLTEFKEKDVKIETIDSSLIIESYGERNSHDIVIGDENIGKTSFFKILYKSLQMKGKVPVYIDGRLIKSSGLDDFQKSLNHAFSEQYNGDDLELFGQKDLKDVFVIIDDFDKVRLQAKYKAKLLVNLQKYFPNLFLSANQFFSFEEFITDELTNGNLFSSFKRYEILEFGYVLKGRLIDRWNQLGREEVLSDEERIVLNQKSESIMDTVVGKNFVPSYPLFLLIILQAIETSNPHELQASSYGHYYQYMIYKSLSKHLRGQDDFNAYYNYLSELSYYFFDKKINSATVSELEEFHDWYRNEYSVKISLTTMLDLFMKAQLLEKYNELYEFKYQYVYYFFVAKKIARDMSNSETRKIVSALSRRLYRSEFANIFLFLTHHSKDDFILEEVVTVASELFSELNPCRLENDISIINNLADKLPEMILKNTSIESNRERENLLKDEKVDSVEEFYDSGEGSLDASLDESTDDIDMVAKMNLAFKTIEILGQILKNGYGDIKASKKIRLAKETYLIGLRTLELYFGFIQENQEIIINMIKSALDKKGIDDKEKKQIEQLSRTILFFSLCTNVVFIY